jgi:CheY-like chemotaxis protein
MRILMVDDEPMVCESMRLMLELDGHSMDQAYSGPAALEKLSTARFDLIFTDFSMPGMKGDQFAREFRRQDVQTPVVMITGFPPTPPPREVTRVMLKPVDLYSVRGLLSEFTR